MALVRRLVWLAGLVASAHSFDVATNLRDYKDSSTSRRMAEVEFCHKFTVVGLYAYIDGHYSARACTTTTTPANHSCISLFWITSSKNFFQFPCFVAGMNNVTQIDLEDQIVLIRQCIGDAFSRIGKSEYNAGTIVVKDSSGFHFQMESAMETRFIMHSNRLADPVMCYQEKEVEWVAVGISIFIFVTIGCWIFACDCCVPCKCECECECADPRRRTVMVARPTGPTIVALAMFLGLASAQNEVVDWLAIDERVQARLKPADSESFSSSEYLSGSNGQCKDVEVIGFKYNYEAPYRCQWDVAVSTEACFNVMWIAHELKPEITWEGQYACRLGIPWTEFELRTENTTIPSLENGLYLLEVRACMLDAMRASWSSQAFDVDRLNENCGSEPECIERAFEGRFFPESNLYLLKSSFPVFLWFDDSNQKAEPRVCWSEAKRHWVAAGIAFACIFCVFGLPNLCECTANINSDCKNANGYRMQIRVAEENNVKIQRQIENAGRTIEMQTLLDRRSSLVRAGDTTALDEIDAQIRDLFRQNNPEATISVVAAPPTAAAVRTPSTAIQVRYLPSVVMMLVVFIMGTLVDQVASEPTTTFARAKVFAGPISFDTNMANVGSCYETHVSEIRCNKAGSNENCILKPCSADGLTMQTCFSMYWVALESESLEEREIEFLCMTDRPFDHENRHDQPDQVTIRQCISSALFSVGRGSDDHGEFYDNGRSFRLKTNDFEKPYVALRFVKFSSTWTEAQNCMFESERGALIFAFIMVGVTIIGLIWCICVCCARSSFCESRTRSLHDSLTILEREQRGLEKRLTDMEKELMRRKRELSLKYREEDLRQIVGYSITTPWV